jgi:16S rRNA (guanine527-N7)-methyltransferase
LVQPLTEAVRAAAAERLRQGAEKLKVELSPDQVSHLIEYLALLHKWGASFNLTAVLDPLEMVTLHLLDSLSIVPLVARYCGRRLVDIGSGAGLPGIPLAIALPALDVTLIDSVQKKTAFQTQAKGTLGLANCTPVHGQMQALTFAKPFDIAVCRALSSVTDAVRLAAFGLPQDGRLIAMKGAVPTDELEVLEPGWNTVAIEPLSVPGLNAQRCAVVLQRRSALRIDDTANAGAHA